MRVISFIVTCVVRFPQEKQSPREIVSARQNTKQRSLHRDREESSVHPEESSVPSAKRIGKQKACETTALSKES